MKLRKPLLCLSLLLAAPSPAPAEPAENKSTQAARDFLRFYDSVYLGLVRTAQEASWRASTDVTPQHEGERTGANTALAAFQGDKVIIETARQLRAHRQELPPLVARQLDKLWLAAAEGPGTIAEVVKRRVAAESRQSAVLDGYTFQLEGKAATANDIDDALAGSTDLQRRQRAWEASKEIGKPLKPGLVELQRLRNQVAREMKFPSYFALQIADYDMTEAEMMQLLDGFLKDTRPLYERLHAYTREALAKRYGQPVPKLIPAHWLSNRWSQAWPGVARGAVDLDPVLKGRSPEWIVKTAEKFYVSMGFPALSKGFWERSDLYPATGGRKKNSHASCWHLDLQDDVRSLMSVQPNDRWFRTSHHELGHGYYFMSYTRPEVPPLLRTGVNRAMHEAVGDLAAIAAGQVPYLEALGLLQKGQKVDTQAALLDEALESALPFIAWSAGTMAHFEQDLYAKDLAPAAWQDRWWQYVARFQGVAPPGPRPAEGCDACTKTHINDNPAYYYSYAIATVLKYQLHDHICTKILKQDPHACNYYGSRAVGDFLQKLLRIGATRPWREVLKEATGEPLSTRALSAYFAPLTPWLDQELKGKAIGW